MRPPCMRPRETGGPGVNAPQQSPARRRRSRRLRGTPNAFALTQNGGRDRQLRASLWSGVGLRAGPVTGQIPVEPPDVVADLIAVGDVGLGRVPVARRTQAVRHEAEAVKALDELALGHRRALCARVMVGIITDRLRRCDNPRDELS